MAISTLNELVIKNWSNLHRTKSRKNEIHHSRKIIDNKRAIYLQYDHENLIEALSTSMKNKKLPKHIYAEFEVELWYFIQALASYRAKQTFLTALKALFIMVLIISCIACSLKFSLTTMWSWQLLLLCVLSYLLFDARLIIILKNSKQLNQHDLQLFIANYGKDDQHLSFTFSLCLSEENHYLEIRKTRRTRLKKPLLPTLPVIQEEIFEEDAAEDNCMNDGKKSINESYK